MHTTLFKIGERAYYGKWRISVTEEQIKCEGLDWDTNKVQESRTFDITDNVRNELEFYLSEVSTSYHADQMIEWVEKYIGLPEHSYTAFTL
ncbi:MAG: hypothetical protein V1799_07610 [bacterium]